MPKLEAPVGKDFQWDCRKTVFHGCPFPPGSAFAAAPVSTTDCQKRPRCSGVNRGRGFVRCGGGEGCTIHKLVTQPSS